MSYRWVEHTSELELEIEAPTEEAVLDDALAAVAELLADGTRGDRVVREISAAAPERAVLLVEWIDELVFVAETESLVAEQVEQMELSDRGVAARVRCHRAQPRTLIKGATLHRLAFERSGEGYWARVVLDV